MFPLEDTATLESSTSIAIVVGPNIIGIVIIWMNIP